MFKKNKGITKTNWKEKNQKQNQTKEPYPHAQNNLLPKLKYALNNMIWKEKLVKYIHTQQTLKNSNSIKLMP